MVGLPTLRPAPGSPAIRWDPGSRRYRDPRGRFVSRQQVREGLDAVLDASDREMGRLSQRPRDGAISLADWEAGMMRQIKITHLAAAVLERGGWQQMTPADFGRVGRQIRDEYARLRNFAAQIASGAQPLDGTLLRRARMYGQAGRGTFYRLAQQSWSERGFDEERSILNPADHCPGCLSQAALGWQPLGQMIPIGQRDCLSNDRCDVEYRNSATGETVRV